jgi:hypothetical protein
MYINATRSITVLYQALYVELDLFQALDLFYPSSCSNLVSFKNLIRSFPSKHILCALMIHRIDPILLVRSLKVFFSMVYCS